MGIPRFFINAIKALYRGGLATVVLMGLRWGSFPILSGIRQGCPASGSLFALAIDPCFRYMISQLGPERGIITAYADDIAAAVKELFEAIKILAHAFSVVGRCSSLELHPGKVVIIPLWKFEEQAVRAALILAAPSLATAVIQNFGKLLGVYIGPGADRRQWLSVREELRSRSRFLASLGLAWGGGVAVVSFACVACCLSCRPNGPAASFHVESRSQLSCHCLESSLSCSPDRSAS
jgi:hypothetical protein